MIFYLEEIIAKPIGSKFNDDERKEVLTWRNMLVMPVKSCIYDILNPDKVNVIDPIKENFTQLYFKTVTYMCQYSSKPEDQ